MITRLLSASAAFALFVVVPAGQTAENQITFDAPATHFTESLPLGNGRLGAMVFGDVGEERIVLNETGMWSGSPQEADRADAHASLAQIRQLLLEGKNAEAEALVNANFTSAGQGSARGRGANAPYGCYQVLGNLRLKFSHAGQEAVAKNYHRELDLGDAIARVSYELAGTCFTREVFVSAADQVIVIRLEASNPGTLAFDLALERPENASTTLAGIDGLQMTGQLPDGRGGKAGVRFAARVCIAEHDGKVSAGGGTVALRGATRATILVAALTDIRTFAGRRADDPLAETAIDLAKATQILSAR